MKAIEILKYNKNIMIKFINSFDDDCKEDDEYISGNKYIEELNEAIKELEELNNRSCINCKYSFDIFTGIDNNLLNEDFICTTLNVDKVFEKDFYCSKYEAKGE